MAGVELEDFALSRRESKTSLGVCVDESCLGFSSFDEDQKLGHCIASACLVERGRLGLLESVEKLDRLSHQRKAIHKYQAFSSLVITN